MILNRDRFLAECRPLWDELELLLSRLDSRNAEPLDFDEVRRLHYLYQRACNDLVRLGACATEPELRQQVEALVARAYSEIHETRSQRLSLSPLHWFFVVVPGAFRRRWRAFALSVAITILGTLFGAGVMTFDPESKHAILPQAFSHITELTPAERVAMEEKGRSQSLGQQTFFSAQLFRNNLSVSLSCLGYGLLAGIGTIVMLFFNGAVLGAVMQEYIQAGFSKFLIAWLLPHGSVEIPAIIIAGQAGFVMAHAVISRDGRPFGLRMRSVLNDVVHLIGLIAVLLFWAALIEAFFSQYHEPVLPASIKIGFGAFQLMVLTVFLARSGVSRSQEIDEAKA